MFCLSFKDLRFKAGCITSPFYSFFPCFPELDKLLAPSRYRFYPLDWSCSTLVFRDFPDIHPVPGKCRVSHYSVLPGPGKKTGPSKKKKKKKFFKFFFTQGINDPLGRQK